MTTAVTNSERAARRIGEILKGEGGGAMLRISVEGGGCSGFQYKFDVDRAKAEDDLVIQRDSAVVLVDPAFEQPDEFEVIQQKALAVKRYFLASDGTPRVNPKAFKVLAKELQPIAEAHGYAFGKPINQPVEQR